ncbi:hypothetical protein [Streptacidiphilus fuscans]|uniref:Uncharacterized protein n=1 Tax=Streptacidiphilus fuscans TaxID=2789292 RepID=A0A931BBG9_9ACTN|nr:hypothetical protein [Streptacidiphilus fuscans]MBF9072177.1 hypothetical protein [Streptacidiphilus fuscans]MBF9072988.1 hypothetical protein [Streptacidiphilus fuscans]
MSLNRGVAALGAVAVVGAATLGITIPLVSGSGKPVPNVAIVAGSHWTQVQPLKDCYYGGNAMTAKQQAACSAAVSKAVQNNSMATAIVPSQNGNFGINVDQPVTDHGWNAGSTTELVQQTTNAYAGPLSIASVLTTQDPQTGQTTVNKSGPLIVKEQDKDGKIYGVWLLQLKVAN